MQLRHERHALHCNALCTCPCALAGLQADAPDAPLTGWNSSSDSYSFAYVSEEEAAAPAEKRAAATAPVKLLLKVLVMGDSSLVTCLATDADGVQPQTLELNLDDYVTPASSNGSNVAGNSSSAAAAESGPLVAKTYKNLDQLCQQVNKALADLTAAAVGSSGGSNGQKKQCTSAATTSGQQQQQQGEAGRSNPGEQGMRPPAEPQQQPDPDYDPLRIEPPRRPLRVGECGVRGVSVEVAAFAARRVVLHKHRTASLPAQSMPVTCAATWWHVKRM